LKQLKTFFSTFLKIFKNLHLLEDFVYLIRWNGRDDLERWRLVLDDGSSVKIKQCIHQIGVSQDYIILMDTSFKFELWQAINNPFSDNKTLARFLRKMLDRPMQPRTTIYIVPRDRLQTGERPLRDRQEVKVVATKVELPLESTHFLVDRENPQNQITLHELYQDYEYQGVQPQQKVIDLAAQGIPACLFRLHAPSNEAMEIADFVKLPAGHAGVRISY